MGQEEEVIASVVPALLEHGQVARQYVTSTLDGNPDAPPDLIFSPNDARGSVVCAEIRTSVVPTFNSASLASVLRHKEVIEQTNPGTVFVLATNARLEGNVKSAADRAGLRVVDIDLENPQALAFAIKLLSLQRQK